MSMFRSTVVHPSGGDPHGGETTPVDVERTAGWPGAIIVFLGFVLLAGQILDSVSFAFFYLFAAPYSHAAEVNPILRVLLATGGPALVVAFKLGIGYRVWRSVPRLSAIRGTGPRKLLWVVLPAASISGLVGFAFNAMAIGTVYGAP